MEHVVVCDVVVYAVCITARVKEGAHLSFMQ